MKVKYKDCDIEAVREKSISGNKLIFFSIFDNGFEINSGFSEGEDTLKDFIYGLENEVDDYRNLKESGD